MVRDIVIKLISETYTFDEVLNQIATETVKEVYGSIESISQSEFFNAGQSGFKPDYKVVVWGFEYSNENVVEINGTKYSVYRTYSRKDDKIELYLTSKVGV